jgi:hypothetical protein
MNNAKHHTVLSKSDGFWGVTYGFVFPVVLSASGGIKVQNQNMSTGMFLPLHYYLKFLCTATSIRNSVKQRVTLAATAEGN